MGTKLENLSVTPPSHADDWCRLWGECVTKSDAVRMLGLSRPKIYQLIESKCLQLAPDGRIITRSAAEYVESGKPEKKSKRGWKLHK